MNTNLKITYSIFIILLALIFIGFYISEFFFVGYLKNQEQLQINNNIKNAFLYLDKKQEKLQSIVMDWGKWDDTYKFINDGNSEYIKLNLAPNSIDNLGINLMLFYNKNNNLVYKLNYDSTSKEFIEFSNDMQFAIENYINNFYNEKELNIFDYNNNYYIIKYTTTTDSLEEMPENGKLIIAKKIDEAAFSELEQILDSKVSISYLKNIETNTLNEINKQGSLKNIGQAINLYDKNNIFTYSLFSNKNNHIVFIFSKSRENYNLGVSRMRTWFVVYSLLVFIVMFLLLLTLNNHISKPFEKNKKNYKSLVTQMRQGLAVHEMICDNSNKPLDYRFLYVNDAFEKMTGLNANDIIGKTVLDIMPNTEKYWIEEYGRVAINGETINYENYSSEIDKYFEVVAYQTQPMQFATIISDITERKVIEEKLKYNYYHDELTGLYNRIYFNENIKNIDISSNLPLSIIVGDINGLKIINDAFGHQVGDEIIKKASKIITESCNSSDIIVKWGGDEFIIIMPNTSLENAEKLVRKMKNVCTTQNFDSAMLSISFGYDTKKSEKEKLETVIKIAEDWMYKNKIIESASMRSSTLNMILNTLLEKNQREEKHSRRVSEICVSIGKALEMSEIEIKKLKVLGLIHDIGKIAINESILNKEGKLSEDEWVEIKKHPEIGYRILSSTNETSELSQHILNHHERLDGKGYPNGILGDKISQMTRILTVADAFDAMTSERTYKKALTKSEAINELMKNCNTQFDAKIVDVFVKKVLPTMENTVNLNHNSVNKID